MNDKESVTPIMPDLETVAVYRSEGHYSHTAPYHPAQAYPEYAFGASALGPDNPAYAAVRGALGLIFPDGFGTPGWNPLREVVRPGDTVILKPNLISDSHETRGDDVVSVITHGSVIRAALDYVAIALRGRGRIVIADAPQCDASFERLAEFNGLPLIQSFYREHSPIQVDVIDLRPEYAHKVNGVIVGHTPLPGDPAGYTAIDLGRASEFYPISHTNPRLYGSEYDVTEVALHHHGDVHEYLICKTILDADVFVNLPKMKTHKKVGVTLNLKNLVGINGNKNWLPHHREGVPATGGDQYAESGLSERLERVLLAMFKRYFPRLGPLRPWLGGPAKDIGRKLFGDTTTDRVRSGNWHGNDTTWRMVLDLNRALRYGDGLGVLHEEPQRRYFSIVDGVIGGEGNGPMGSDPRPEGVIVAGLAPLAVDLVCARIMGFDFRRIPMLYNALKDHTYPLNTIPYDNIRCRSNVREHDRLLNQIAGPGFAFRPHFGWVGHVAVTDPITSTVLDRQPPTPAQV
jgi:uncharacterized protein (DUF362 family)